MTPSEAAAIMGAMSKGKKKTITDADRVRRSEWAKKLHTFRKSKKENQNER